MQTVHLKRALGLYFLVSSLAYIPAAVFMVGMENPYGPAWVIPALPLAQGLVLAVAGLWLYRSEPTHDSHVDLPWPPIDSFLQLFGIWFVAGGFVSLVRPVSGVLFFGWTGGSVGSDLVSAAASVVIGACLLAWPQWLASFLSRKDPDTRGNPSQENSVR